MSTIQTTVKRTPTRWPGTIVTTACALIAVAVVVLFLALVGGSRGHHAAISQPAATYYPGIQYRGTGAGPASTAGTHPTTPAPGSPRKSYGAVP